MKIEHAEIYKDIRKTVNGIVWIMGRGMAWRGLLAQWIFENVFKNMKGIKKE